MSLDLHHGDCEIVLSSMLTASVDALVTDPPAGIAFMNQEWDTDKGGPDKWRAWLTGVMTECLRVLKPGAHGLVWALPKTSHWTAMALKGAGFEIRDRVSHIFGSGFPKNHSIPLAIDRHLGVTPEKVGSRPQTGAKFQQAADTIDNGEFNDPNRETYDVVRPSSPEGKQWEGWGTALKPAVEDWWLVRKPLDGSITNNVLTHGVGAINIDGCRIHYSDVSTERRRHGGGIVGNASSYELPDSNSVMPAGRWPSHLFLSHDDRCTSYLCVRDCPLWQIGDEARFFYCPKPTTAEKDDGLDGFDGSAMGCRGGISGALKQDRFEARKVNDGRETPIDNAYQRGETLRKNIHPTVKSISLMSYLIRLITPPSGIVLDPFMGSGTTGVAAVLGGWHFVGVEQDPRFFDIATARIQAAENSRQLLLNLNTV